MARQQRFDWFLANQRQRNSKSLQSRRALRSRKPRFEPLEVRNFLSVNAAGMFATCEPAALPDAALESPHVLWASKEAFELNEATAGPVNFDARTPWIDLDPVTDGIQITYSYSNLLDGTLPGGLTPDELRAATEEALGLWAAYAPLDFIEVLDSGPEASDAPYGAADHPTLRIGHHLIDGPSSVLAHAYFPTPGGGGLGGDVHLDSGDGWQTDPNGGGFDVIEVMTHELGHALGLGHETAFDAIMNPFYGRRFNGLGTGFLLDDDIAGIQDLYSEGVGGITPIRPLVVNSSADVDDIVSTEDPDTGIVTHVDQTPDDLTLREAIRFSSISNGRREISFDETIYGSTIQLDTSLGSYVIDTKMTITGAGAQITILAPGSDDPSGNAFRIFNIDNDDFDEETPDTIAEVFVSGLTLTGGVSDEAGGAIFTSENLTLEDMNIHGNSAVGTGGAIFASGHLSLLRSTIENNTATDDGGGIHAKSGAIIDKSVFVNNHSDDEGGAIAGEGEGTELIITSSTLSGNTANGNGGAIHILDENPTKFRVLHSTIYQNHADFDNNGSGSGGGIYMFDGVLALEHSIVAANTDNGVAPDLDNLNLFATPKILTRYSLISNANGSVIVQQDPNLLNVDPQLSPLADNGGGTRSHKPLETSPVLNAGDPNLPFPMDFDQRGLGFKRIQEKVIDIGAIESGGFLQSFTVNTLIDKDDVTLAGVDTSPEDTSLREAVTLANLQLGNNLINFAASLNGGTINLSDSLSGGGGEILITDNLTIDASDLTGGLTINAQTLDPTPSQNNGDGSRLFRLDDGNVATYMNTLFVGLTLSGGDVDGDGGAIHSVENLTLQFVSVLDNYASGDGGGIYQKPVEPASELVVGSKLLIENSTLANNTAGGDGGGLYTNNQKVTLNPEPDPIPLVGQVINTTVSNNVAGSEGGGIYNFDGHLELRHVTVTENQATHGSGVVSYGDARTKTEVYSSIIAGNVVNPNETGFDVQSALDGPGNSFVSLGYNLIGIGNTVLVFNNNDLIEVLDPKLQPLGNNGGKTKTHALQPSSPAIDASDPNAVLTKTEGSETEVLVTNFDQRGEPFSRIGDGNEDGTSRLDIGAFEIQTPEPTGDFDNDGDIDGADFLAWQRGFGKTDAERTDGDSDLDHDVDAEDLLTWSDQYGAVGPAAVIVNTVNTKSMAPVASMARPVISTTSTTAAVSSAVLTQPVSLPTRAHHAGSSNSDLVDSNLVNSNLVNSGMAVAASYFDRESSVLSDSLVGFERSADFAPSRAANLLPLPPASEVRGSGVEGSAEDNSAGGSRSRAQSDQESTASLDKVSLDAVFEGLGLGEIF